mmetsp:Transcript_85211/g.244654  ORF Transcript_85211/g.244654 Transcript_85211/m.244654 type:complete len:227 (-) Transcript_85211:67-747(-)
MLADHLTHAGSGLEQGIAGLLFGLLQDALPAHLDLQVGGNITISCMDKLKLTIEALIDLLLGERSPAQNVFLQRITVLREELDCVACSVAFELGLELEIHAGSGPRMRGRDIVRRHVRQRDRRRHLGLHLAPNLHFNKDIRLATQDVPDAKTGHPNDRHLNVVRRNLLLVLSLLAAQQGLLINNAGLGWFGIACGRRSGRCRSGGLGCLDCGLAGGAAHCGKKEKC